MCKITDMLFLLRRDAEGGGGVGAVTRRRSARVLLDREQGVQVTLSPRSRQRESVRTGGRDGLPSSCFVPFIECTKAAALLSREMNPSAL